MREDEGSLGFERDADEGDSFLEGIIKVVNVHEVYVLGGYTADSHISFADFAYLSVD